MRQLAIVLALLSHGVCSAESGLTVLADRAELAGPFLLNVSYERSRGEHFMTSRSRIVSFRQTDESSLEVLEIGRSGAASPHVIAVIPILAESSGRLTVDFNAGLDRVYLEEDRTGEDYYGRVDRRDYSHFRLFDRSLHDVHRHGNTLVLRQHAVDWGGDPVTVHYYLRPYRPNPGFEPFDLGDLKHFGFYQSYPHATPDRSVLFATRFDIRKPVTFALSSAIPEEHRDAVRDGILYWNRAFDLPVLKAIDAPEGVSAPSAVYNIIEWNPVGGHSSTSHIQIDPLTGEILHAHIFIMPWRHQDPSFDTGDLLRWLVAHEVGHALGLRHNFARGPVSTVMNYFNLREAARIGREVIAGDGDALEYDKRVIRGVYLALPLNVETLPAFCTDSQPRCDPFYRGFDRGRRAIGAADGRRAP